MPPVDFKALFEASPNAYMLLDRDLRYVAANDAYLRATASRLDDLLGRHIFDVFPHDRADPVNESAMRLRTSLERVLHTGQPDVLALIRYRVPRLVNGGIAVEEDRYWSATHIPITDDQGAVAYVLQHTVDVTELQHLREQAGASPAAAGTNQLEAGVLRRASEVQESNVTLDTERRRLRQLFEQAPGFMCFLRGPEHVFEIANAAYYQLVGHREILGKTVREALPEFVDQGYFDLLNRVFTTKQAYLGRGMLVVVQEHPGAPPIEKFVDFSYQPIFDAAGAVMGILAQGYDITMQKRQEGELEALLRELQVRADLDRQLIGIVSHDLRSPLNAIGIAAALLNARGGLDPHSLEIVQRIKSSSDRATRLIRDFLDYTQARVSGRFPVSPREADLHAIARQTFDEVKLGYQRRDGMIAHHGDGTGVWDADRIAQLIGNLVGNAFQHSPPTGTVHVATRGADDEVVIEVHNEGSVIPPENLAALFEPFERGTDVGSEGRRSVGLGLFIARQIVDAHGGRIDVRSTEAEGTRFIVRLPRHARPAAAAGTLAG
jgi:signal transduction histidine kinase